MFIRTNTRTETLAAVAPQSSPSVPGTAAVGLIVPEGFTKIAVLTARVSTSGPTQVRASAPALIGAQGPAEIPLGGRLKFAAYETDNDEGIYVFSFDDPSQSKFDPACKDELEGAPDERTEGGRSFRKLDSTRVTFSFSGGAAPTINNPFDSAQQIPLVEVEDNPCDPDHPNVFYMRGVRRPIASEELKLLASFSGDTGDMRSGELLVTVKNSTLGGGIRLSAEETAKVQNAIVETAGRTGIPPQLIKAQIEQETGGTFSPESFRYEPITIDFNRINLQKASFRSNAFVRRHLRAGFATPVGTASKCKVLLGPNAATLPADAGCGDPIAAGNGVGPFQVEEGTVSIAGRQGQFADPLPGNYRVPVTITQTPSSAAQLHFQEAPQWTHREQVRGLFANGIEFAPQTPPLPPIPIDRVVFDYFSNQVTLGRPLGEGERIRFDYQIIQELDTVDGGDCTGANALDPSFFNGKANNSIEPITFVAGETIGNWFVGHMNGDPGINRQETGGAILFTGAPAEQHVEFKIDFTQPRGKKRVGAMDARIRSATAQFIAAGSFGYLHSTILPWAEAGGQKVLDTLNAAFNLDERCLTDLANPSNPNRELDGMLLAAAFHTNTLRNSSAACSGRCDQIEWAKRWAKVIQAYNSRDDAYKVSPSTGLSPIARRAMSEFFAR